MGELNVLLLSPSRDDTTVVSPIQNIREDFFYLREFVSDADLN